MKCRGPAPLLSKRHLRTSAQGNLSAAQLKVELSPPVSVRTVQRILADVDWLVYAKMENTLALTVADMGARKSWAKDMLLHEDAGSVWDSIFFSEEKNGILTGPTAFSTTGEMCASPSARRSDVKLEVGPSWFGPLSGPMASLHLLC
uniref:Transposase n=1 Tax=Peronospora matthiolae TaxID=2874970 RepID=A0AAV1U0W8_9STRA